MALKMIDLPSDKEMQKNILYTYATASPEDTSEGILWYGEAYNECERIAKKYTLDTSTVVALVSVVSPSLMWGGNVQSPEKIIDLWERAVPVEQWTGFAIYPANLHKAVRILNGDMTAIRGLKVESFFQNIMGNVSEVTIDRWALRVALDNPKLGADKITPSGKGVYNAVADAYRAVADMLGQDVPDVQAVCWCHFRNKYNGRVRKEKLAKLKREVAVPVLVS